MYTELYLGIKLKTETPKEIIDFLQWCNTDRSSDAPKSQHDFFKTDRMEVFGIMSSAYFMAKPVFSFDVDSLYPDKPTYDLTTVFNLKNYDDEIDKFLNLIEPYVYYDDHMGHVRYEEDCIPTLLVYKNGKIERIRPCNMQD